MKKSKIFSVAALSAASLLLVACGGSGTTASESTETETNASAPMASDVEQVTWAHACGLPGCWYHVPMYVAQKFGFFEKYGANVVIQPMKSGGDIVQATQTGEISGGHIGTDPFLVGAPKGLNIVGIMGENKQDWILVSRDPAIQKCADLKGKKIGAQAPGDARWLILSAIIEGCGEGLTIDDVSTVDPNNDYVGVLVSGVLDTMVVHLDELAQVESLTTDKWTTVAALSDLQEKHYAMHIVNKDVLGSNREGVVRLTAALIDATKFMQDPANFDDIVAYLSSEGIIKQEDPALAGAVFTQFLNFGQWEFDNNGLNTTYLQNSIDAQVKAKSIDASYEASTILDTTVWDEAYAKVQAQG
jgi:ABC-type nitrate/sulfonate/bicarbonate transport system substrate-binding protein